ncbi:hypothetical protein N7467_006518 [Penicillium canescens]|nr:hypothetical protein N7467_006518 [Penicillium canescens]
MVRENVNPLTIKDPPNLVPADSVYINWKYTSSDDVYRMFSYTVILRSTDLFHQPTVDLCRSMSYATIPSHFFEQKVRGRYSELIVPEMMFSAMSPGATSSIDVVFYRGQYNAYFEDYEILTGCTSIGMTVFASTTASDVLVPSTTPAFHASAALLTTPAATDTSTTATDTSTTATDATTAIRDSAPTSTLTPGGREHATEIADQGLSSGEKAGIGVGVSVGILMVFTGSYFYISRRRASQNKSDRPGGHE